MREDLNALSFADGGLAIFLHLAEMMLGLGVRPTRATPLPKAVPPSGIGDALAALLHRGS